MFKKIEQMSNGEVLAAIKGNIFRMNFLGEESEGLKPRTMELLGSLKRRQMDLRGIRISPIIPDNSRLN